MTSDPILRESLSFRLMDGSLGEEFLQMVRARLVDDYPRQVRACLQLLDEEDVWWRPNDHANAVGNLVLHVSGSNRFYLEHVIAGGPDVRNRDAEFAARGAIAKREVEHVWADTERLVQRVMQAMTPARLTETSDRSGRRRHVCPHSPARQPSQRDARGADHLDHQASPARRAARTVAHASAILEVTLAGRGPRLTRKAALSNTLTGRSNTQMRITSKGQVTIPLPIREQLGLLPNTEVEFEIDRDAVRMRRAKTPRKTDRGRALIEHMRGRGTRRITTDEIMKLTRG